MKIHGEFVLRDIVQEIVAVPVGETALQFHGMIMLNQASRIIWQCLQTETDLPTIVKAVTDAFDVSDQEAETDILEFLDQLRAAQLLEE